MPLLPNTPTGYPCIDIKPQIIVGPKSGLNSSNFDPSAILPMISLMSKGVFKLGSIKPKRSSWL